MCGIINNIKISLVTPLRLVHVLLIVMVSDYEHMGKVLLRCWYYVGVMLLVEQRNWIDPILMYRGTHRQLGYRYFIMCQSITVTRSFAPQDIWTLGYNMDVARLSNVMSMTGSYKDDLCSYRMVLQCVAWCSCGICYYGDGEIHSGNPLYYYGVRHRLARHVTKLLCHRNIDNMDEQRVHDR